MRKLIFAAAMLVGMASTALAQSTEVDTSTAKPIILSDLYGASGPIARQSLPMEDVTFADGLDFMFTLDITLGAMQDSIRKGQSNVNFYYTTTPDFEYLMLVNLSKGEIARNTILNNILGGNSKTMTTLENALPPILARDTSSCHYLAFQWQKVEASAFLICDSGLNNGSFVIQKAPIIQELIDLID